MLHPQPDWNSPRSLADALALCARAHDASSSTGASERLLDAVGNNHAGTYFPVVLDAVSGMHSVLDQGSPWAQRSVLEVLLDVHSSFQADAAFEMYQGRRLDETLRERIAALAPLVARIAKANTVASGSAVDLQLLLAPPLPGKA
ncbi:MAG: hypothetical protein RLZZ618_1392 [Pseudomonadota bacterium]|jgi:hypothetical protein